MDNFIKVNDNSNNFGSLCKIEKSQKIIKTKKKLLNY